MDSRSIYLQTHQFFESFFCFSLFANNETKKVSEMATMTTSSAPASSSSSSSSSSNNNNNIIIINNRAVDTTTLSLPSSSSSSSSLTLQSSETEARRLHILEHMQPETPWNIHVGNGVLHVHVFENSKEGATRHVESLKFVEAAYSKVLKRVMKMSCKRINNKPETWDGDISIDHYLQLMDPDTAMLVCQFLTMTSSFPPLAPHWQIITCNPSEFRLFMTTHNPSYWEWLSALSVKNIVLLYNASDQLDIPILLLFLRGYFIYMTDTQPELLQTEMAALDTLELENLFVV